MVDKMADPRAFAYYVEGSALFLPPDSDACKLIDDAAKILRRLPAAARNVSIDETKLPPPIPLHYTPDGNRIACEALVREIKVIETGKVTTDIDILYAERVGAADTFFIWRYQRAFDGRPPPLIDPIFVAQRLALQRWRLAGFLTTEDARMLDAAARGDPDECALPPRGNRQRAACHL